ncbi:hypothetical protein BDV38DRAFT_234380 [Aspergillus pseudotamarii]|uniref:Uncharacterized protein n=1 Tax=Aspergillus pseudotamarii TaxID=132259 RepID=A0A5N6T9H7_ASPPS|nr:uncharacterized protein BDV38DRAFT_234380 [Aspergillus pseudotamarii]KAE8143005.1 hypothetical protein BDV38DRAFT_234380 [Aspergillus pseudotamarii]
MLRKQKRTLIIKNPRAGQDEAVRETEGQPDIAIHDGPRRGPSVRQAIAANAHEFIFLYFSGFLILFLMRVGRNDLPYQ